MQVYADNAATTRMHQTAIDTMTYHLNNTFGNPSSLYTIGQQAKEVLETARADMAACFGAQPREIYFTSGGSEADNQAITSAAYLGARKGKKHIISTTFEHHAVLHTLKRLEKQGFEVTLLDVHADGLVSAQQIADAIRDDTCLVTIMFANNEIGTIQPIEAIGAVCHERGIILTNPIEGGAQERGKRGGTENVPGIAAMAAALTEACANMDGNTKKVTALRDKLIDGISKIPHCALNGAREPRLPGNVNFCFEGIEGESLLLLLDAKGISASSGSACTSGSLDPSHVLLAIGRPHEVAHGSLRLTICEDNTEEEIDYILAELPPIVDDLRNMSPVWKDLMSGKRQFTL